MEQKMMEKVMCSDLNRIRIQNTEHRILYSVKFC